MYYSPKDGEGFNSTLSSYYVLIGKIIGELFYYLIPIILPFVKPKTHLSLFLGEKGFGIFLFVKREYFKHPFDCFYCLLF